MAILGVSAWPGPLCPVSYPPLLHLPVKQEQGEARRFPAPSPGSAASVVLLLPARPWGSGWCQVPLCSVNSLLLCPSKLEAALASRSTDYRANLTSSISSVLSEVLPSSWTLARESLADPKPLPGSCRTTVLLPTLCPLLPSFHADLIGHQSSVSHLLRTFQRHLYLHRHSLAQTTILSYLAPCSSFLPSLTPTRFLWNPALVPSLSWLLSLCDWDRAVPVLASCLNCQPVLSSFLHISPQVSSRSLMPTTSQTGHLVSSFVPQPPTPCLHFRERPTAP